MVERNLINFTNPVEIIAITILANNNIPNNYYNHLKIHPYQHIISYNPTAEKGYDERPNLRMGIYVSTIFVYNNYVIEEYN
jgi:hypothetical protein